MKEHIKGRGVVTQNEGIELHSYKVMINEADQVLKVVFKDRTGKTVGTFTADAPEDAYLLSAKILRGYDKLEGI